MKKKILFTSHLANFVKFNWPYMAWFERQGWEVHYASLDEEEIPCCDAHFTVGFHRSPYHLRNLKAFFQLRRLLKREQYQIIHCHTPVGGAVTRLAAFSLGKRETKVLYTAHGFHFYRGAPWKNWLLYYPIERLLSHCTDGIITINREDYALASRFPLGRRGGVFYLPGVGVDVRRIEAALAGLDREKKRRELGIPSGKLVLLSVGELNENKNHQVVLRAIGKLGRDDLHYCICGEGEQRPALEQLCRQLGIQDQVTFLGYRRDVFEILGCAHLFLFPSIREGLGLAALEAMAAGLPLIVSDTRGTREYTREGETGFLCPAMDVEAFARCIRRLAEDEELRKEMGERNRKEARRFSLERTVEEMGKIYRRWM